MMGKRRVMKDAGGSRPADWGNVEGCELGLRELFVRLCGPCVGWASRG